MDPTTDIPSGEEDYSTRDPKMGTVDLFGIPIVCLSIDDKERLCLAQISNTLLRDFSYNEIHNRRVALGITCLQCTPVQLEILRRTGAMPVSSRRCGLITKREAERLVKSFLEAIPPPRLPETFHSVCTTTADGAVRDSSFPRDTTVREQNASSASFAMLSFRLINLFSITTNPLHQHTDTRTPPILTLGDAIYS